MRTLLTSLSRHSVNRFIKRFIGITIFGSILLIIPVFSQAKIWVPISVDDITIIVPVEQKWSTEPGANNPGPTCSQQLNGAWKDLFCNFLSKAQFDSHLAHTGKSYYYPTPGNPWQPVYNNEGLLEYIKQPWPGGQVRYTPWSQQISSADPYPLAWRIGANTSNYCPDSIERRCILGFGFTEFAYDPDDPTQSFDEGILGYFLNMVEAYRAENLIGSNPNFLYNLNNVATGAMFGLIQDPDWIFDGKTFLVCPTGNTEPCNSGSNRNIPTLEEASDLAFTYKFVFANGSNNNIVDGLNTAQEIANHLGRPIITMYHAQDLNYWRPLGDTPFMQRFQELVNLTQYKARGTNSNVEYLCHSNSVYKCLIATYSYDNAVLLGINPAHEPFGSQTVYLSLMPNVEGTFYIIGGYDDFVSNIFTGGTGFPIINFAGVTIYKGSQNVYNIVQSEPNIFEDIWTPVGSFDHPIQTMLDATIGYDYYGRPQYGWDYVEAFLPPF